MEEIDKTVNNVRVYTDKAENRLKIAFPGKPSAEIMTGLKRNGFRWSPRNKTWQRMISNQAIYLAEKIQGMVGINGNFHPSDWEPLEKAMLNPDQILLGVNFPQV